MSRQVVACSFFFFFYLLYFLEPFERMILIVISEMVRKKAPSVTCCCAFPTNYVLLKIIFYLELVFCEIKRNKRGTMELPFRLFLTLLSFQLISAKSIPIRMKYQNEICIFPIVSKKQIYCLFVILFFSYLIFFSFVETLKTYRILFIWLVILLLKIFITLADPSGVDQLRSNNLEYT